MSRAATLNYHHAELLFHVLRARTLTDAAAAMHISQPAVTKQLRLLEDSLGVKLFRKKGRHLVPTVEAMLLAEEVERTRASLLSLNELAMRLRSGVAGKLVVCAIPALARILLPGAIGNFRKNHPGIHLEIKVENSWRIMDLAEAQQIDMGICYPFRDVRQVDETLLLDSTIVCAIREGDPFSNKGKLKLAELRGRPLVVVDALTTKPDVRNALTTSGLERDVVCHVSASTLACEIVLSSGGVALVDSLTAATYRSQGIKAIQIPELPARQISLLRPKLRATSLFAESFAHALSAQADLFHPAAAQR